MAKLKNMVFETLANTYRPTDQLGQGGNGRVFLVTDEEGNEYALKRLSPEVVSKDKVKRFRNEMLFLQKQVHPNLMPVIDYGFQIVDEKKLPFYVMPVCRQSLRDLIQSSIRPESVLSYFSSMLDGVEALHIKGVVHRDLKPENILLDEKTDTLLIADLGIAHFEEDELHTFVKTKAGERLANYMYAAPEQRNGGIGTIRSDIFALGLILNEMFTGEVLHAHGHRTIADFSSEHGYLDELVTFMVQQDSDNRPKSIDVIKQELIGRKNDFVERQRLNELENTVVSVRSVDDDFLIANPPKPIGVEFDGRNLIFFLKPSVTSEWADVFKNQNFDSALWGASPREFGIRGDRAVVSAKEQDIKRIAADFKRWVVAANAKYQNKKERERAEYEEQERRKLQAEIERRKKNEDVRKNILSQISFD